MGSNRWIRKSPERSIYEKTFDLLERHCDSETTIKELLSARGNLGKDKMHLTGKAMPKMGKALGRI